MKIKIFSFVMALTLLLGTFITPEKVYAAENDYIFTVNGIEIDLTSFIDDWSMYYDGIINEPKYILFQKDRDGSTNSYVLFIIDSTINSGIVVKSDNGFNEFIYNSSAYDRCLDLRFCALKKDGSYDVTDMSGVYRQGLEITNGSIKALHNPQQAYSSDMFRLYKSHMDIYGATSPSELLPMCFDGEMTVKGASYVDGSWQIDSVFFQPLPRTILSKVTKGIQMNPLDQILKILPIMMVCLVGYVGLRKALQILVRILHQA